MDDVSIYPIVKQSYEVSLAIEECEASEKQTNASIKSSTFTSALYDHQGKQDVIMVDLSMLIRMLITKHKRGKLDDEYCAKALDYLQRKGLQGNILRTEEPS